MQWPQPAFPHAADPRQVPSGEALNEAAEDTADGAAVPYHAQPAAAYEGKQGDQCGDHRGDGSHWTCLNTHTFTQLSIHNHTHTHTLYGSRLA